MSGQAAVPAGADRVGQALTGYVEAVTERAALGWVWRPGHADRVAVELRLGEEVVSRAVADLMRDDLQQSGIGDGRHAFSLPIDEPLASRATEMRVFALGGDGTATPLDLPPPANQQSDPVTLRMQRGLDALVSSQRVLHRNLQAALLQRSAPADGSLAELRACQASLQESVATIELFVARLEQALPVRDPTPARTIPNRALIGTFALSLTALIAAAAALTRSILGG